MLVFYSPSGIHSLFKNFPKFKQNNTRIAGFGTNTAKAIKENNLISIPLKDTRHFKLPLKKLFLNY